MTNTTLQPESIPSPKPDSLSTQINLDLTVSRASGGLSLQGTIRTVSISGTVRIPFGTEIQDLPKAFTGTLKQGELFLKPFSSEPGNAVYDCTESRPAVASALQRALILPPEQITPTTTWSDTVTISTCLGTLSVRSTTIRSYRLPREITLGSHRSIAFERHDTVTLNGTGSTGQHRLTISAEGSGAGNSSIDAETGTLVEATGHQRTRIQITSSGRQQIFIQSTDERIIRTGS